VISQREVMMDFRQIQYFLCLAQERNVTRAARRLNIVQPALSMQLAKLEASLGKQLFFRTPQGVLLSKTSIGRERRWRVSTARSPDGSALA
jgi:LysR family transcriptional regulator, nitrogen assimilation regulatory protein